MKIIRFTAILLAIALLPLQGGPAEKVVKTFPLQAKRAYQVGEELNYRVHYGLVEAGVASIKVKSQTQVKGTPVYHMEGTGRSVGITEWLFPTRDVYTTYIDTHSLLPLKFVRDVNEGGYIIKQNIAFNRKTNTAIDYDLKKDTVFKLPANVQDIFSVFYYTRNLNVANIAPGDLIEVPVFLDHELFPFKIRFVRKEIVNTSFGKIQCLKFVPVVQSGRVFKDEDDLMIWISDDHMHIPIRIKSELLVGSIKVDLTGYKGLTGTLNFVK